MKTKKPNIILIVLDSARAEAFSCYGNKLPTSPNIDKIAKEGMLFKNSYSTAPITLPAHISMFTGNYWSTHGIKNSCKKTTTNLLSDVLPTLKVLS